VNRVPPPVLIEKSPIRAHYGSYCDSGVAWLGMVPAHWHVLRIKQLAGQGYRTFTDGDWIESPFITDDGIRLLQTGNIGVGRFKEQGYRYISVETFLKLGCTEVLPGDVLICRLADPVGRACVAPDLGVRMITSVDVCILRPSALHSSKFIMYSLSNLQYLSWLQALSRGGTRDRISRSMLSQIGFLAPPLDEQNAIAAWLDRETLKIDALICKKERLIALLQEKRAALISNAVTRGLDPDAPMRDSGIAWLGQVPEHWRCSPLKRLADVIDCKHYTVEFLDDGCPVVSIRELRDDRVNLHNAKRTSRHEWDFLREGRTPQYGDIIFCRNASVGTLGYVDTEEPFCMGQDVCLIRPTESSRFVYYQISSVLVRNQIEAYLIGATIRRLNVEEIRSLILIDLPNPEKRAITAYLECETARLDALTTKVQEHIERLHEYRAALISAAVTGKIAVRGEAG
jgi:type I restriction enzyme S subunit